MVTWSSPGTSWASARRDTPMPGAGASGLCDRTSCHGAAWALRQLVILPKSSESSGSPAPLVASTRAAMVRPDSSVTDPSGLSLLT